MPLPAFWRLLMTAAKRPGVARLARGYFGVEDKGSSKKPELDAGEIEELRTFLG